jgi:hypothetical protein
MTRITTNDMVMCGRTEHGAARRVNPPEQMRRMDTKPASNQRRKPGFEQWPAGIAKV